LNFRRLKLPHPQPYSFESSILSENPLPKTMQKFSMNEKLLDLSKSSRAQNSFTFDVSDLESTQQTPTTSVDKNSNISFDPFDQKIPTDDWATLAEEEEVEEFPQFEEEIGFEEDQPSYTSERSFELRGRGRSPGRRGNYKPDPSFEHSRRNTSNPNSGYNRGRSPTPRLDTSNSGYNRGRSPGPNSGHNRGRSPGPNRDYNRGKSPNPRRGQSPGPNRDYNPNSGHNRGRSSGPDPSYNDQSHRPNEKPRSLKAPNFNGTLTAEFMDDWKRDCHRVPPPIIYQICKKAHQDGKFDSFMFFFASLMENKNFFTIMNDSDVTNFILEKTNVRFSEGPLHKCDQFAVKVNGAFTCTSRGCSYYISDEVHFYCPKHVCDLVRDHKEPRDEVALLKLFNINRG